MAARQRILILDDEHDILDIYQEILARLPSQPEIQSQVWPILNSKHQQKREKLYFVPDPSPSMQNPPAAAAGVGCPIRVQ